MDSNFVRPKEGFRFTYGGMKLNDVADALPPDRYPLALNVRAYQINSITTRPGQVLKFSTGGNRILGLHSYTAIQTDNVPRYLAVDDQWDVWLDNSTQVGDLITGDLEGLAPGAGVSMVPFRPNQSPQSYMYIANGQAYQKFSAPTPTVTQSNVGIAEPQTAPGAVIEQFGLVPIVSGDPGWTHGGTAGAATPGTRISDTVGAVLTDPENPGTAPWTIGVGGGIDYQRNMTLSIAGNLAFVQDVFAPLPSPLNIESIFYFSGTTGHCVLVPANLAGPATAEEQSIYAASILTSLRRGAMITIGGEVCYVWSSTLGPDGSVAIETSTFGAHTPADQLRAQAAIQIMGGGVPATLQAITAVDDTYTVTTGIGTQSRSITPFNPFVSGGVAFQPDDYITFGLQVDHPESLSEVDILFDVGDGSFTQNYYYYAIRQSDIAGYLANTETQLAAVQEIEQKAIIDALTPNAANNQLTSFTSAMTAPGVTQWTQVFVPLSSFTRVGADDRLTLQNINAVQIKWNCIANINVATAEMDVEGSFQPDVGDVGAPYMYRCRGRSKVTGVVSNPSPPTRYGVSPRREQVLVNLPGPDDPQIDTWDIYRYGGSVTSWRWIGQVTAGLFGSQFFDNFSDDAANGGDALEFDNFEPWPTVDVPNNGTASSVVGTTSVVSTTDTDIVRYLPGTLVQIGGQNIYTLYTRPTLISGNNYLLQFVENAGTGTNLPYQITEPLLANQHAPYVWGPDAAGTVFSCGDVFRPGTLSFSKNYAPDSAPDTYNIEVASPSEPLLGGVVLDGLSFVGSGARWWALYPQPDNPTQRYNPVQQPFPRGIACPFGIATDGRSIFWWAKDGIWSSTQGSLTDADLSTLFPHEGIAGQNYVYNGANVNAPDYSRAAFFRLTYANGFLYAIYQDSNGTYQQLTCDLRNGRVAWCQDEAIPALTFVFQPEQPASAENSNVRYDEVVQGTTDGRIAVETTNSNDLGGPVIATLATFEFDGGDLRAFEQWGDVYVDTVPAGGLTVIPLSTGVVVWPPTNLAPSPNRTLEPPISVGGANLQDFLGLRFVWADDYTTQSTATILNAWQPSFLVKPETSGDRFSDWDEGGETGAKWWQGFILHADTFNVIKPLNIRDADTLSLHTFTPAVQHNGESEIAYSFDVPFIAHMVRIEPANNLPWRYFGVRWIAETTPETGETWQTQFSTHGLTGYMHLRQLSLTYASSAPVTFQATSYDGTSPAVITLPSTGGAVEKIVFPFTFNKGQLYAYKASSSTPFQIYVDKSEVLVGQWARQGGYQNVPLVGGVGGDQAKV